MKKILPILITLCSFYNGQSQNYSEGYIVKHTGDTLKGFIDIKDLRGEIEKIKFKKDLSSKEEIYLADSIHAFKTENDLFIKAKVKIEISPYNFNMMDDYYELAFREETVFLKSLVLGEKSLFFLKLKNFKEQYYIPKGKEFELLEHKFYKKTFNGKTNVVQNRTFVNQLAPYLDGCPEILSKVRSVNYTQNELMSLFSNYYKCKSINTTYSRKKERSTWTGGVLVGMSISSFDFSGNYLSRSFEPSNYPHSNNLALGSYFETELTKTKNRLSFRNELVLTSYKTGYDIDGFYQTSDPLVFISIGRREINLTYLKLLSMAKYRRLISNKVSMFINGGVTIAGAIIEKHSVVIDGKKRANQFPLVTSRLEVGLVGGGGISYSKFALDFKFEKTTGFDPYNQSRVKRLYMTISYQLF